MKVDCLHTLSFQYKTIRLFNPQERRDGSQTRSSKAAVPKTDCVDKVDLIFVFKKNCIEKVTLEREENTKSPFDFRILLNLRLTLAEILLSKANTLPSQHMDFQRISPRQVIKN